MFCICALGRGAKNENNIKNNSKYNNIIETIFINKESRSKEILKYLKKYTLPF